MHINRTISSVIRPLISIDCIWSLGKQIWGRKYYEGITFNTKHDESFLKPRGYSPVLRLSLAWSKISDFNVTHGIFDSGEPRGDSAVRHGSLQCRLEFEYAVACLQSPSALVPMTRVMFSPELSTIALEGGSSLRIRSRTVPCSIAFEQGGPMQASDQ